MISRLPLHAGAVPAAEGSGLAVTRVGVVIPAHDEEVLLPACLSALGAAAARAGGRVDRI